MDEVDGPAIALDSNFVGGPVRPTCPVGTVPVYRAFRATAVRRRWYAINLSISSVSGGRTRRSCFATYAMEILSMVGAGERDLSQAVYVKNYERFATSQIFQPLLQRAAFDSTTSTTSERAARPGYLCGLSPRWLGFSTMASFWAI